MTIAISGTTGITLDGQFNSASSMGFKNRIINGAMVIDQRNAGASVTVSGATGVYTIDRIFIRPNSSTNTSVIRSTDAPTGFTNSLKVTRVSGQTGTLTRVQTALETLNMTDLQQQIVTLSFYAKADSGYTPNSSELAVNLYVGNGTERVRSITSYDNQTTPIATNVTLTTSWQKFTLTSSSLPSDLSQLTVEFAPTWVGTAPSNDGFFITGVQLEKGSTATSFDYRPYQTELALAQRYYAKFSSLSGVYVGFGSGVSTATTSAAIVVKYPVRMRSAPTISQSNTGLYDGGSIPAVTSIGGSYYGDESVFANLNVASGLTLGRGCLWCGANNASAYIDFSSEL